MAINLQKGGKFNLTKQEPGLKKALIGLGWELKTTQALDLDASIFMLSSSGKVPVEEFFIFYNNLKSPDGSVQHTGDNRSGIGDDDDEMVLANLASVDAVIQEIIIIVSIHDGIAKRQHFGLLADAYIRIVDVDTKREILRYNLGSEFSDMTEVEFGRLRRENNEWQFQATGNGTKIGLEGYVNKYT